MKSSRRITNLLLANMLRAGASSFTTFISVLVFSKAIYLFFCVAQIGSKHSRVPIRSDPTFSTPALCYFLPDENLFPHCAVSPVDALVSTPSTRQARRKFSTFLMSQACQKIRLKLLLHILMKMKRLTAFDYVCQEHIDF